MSSIRLSEGKIRFTPASLQQAADALAQLLVEQIHARLDMNGNSFPSGVDLIQTGALLRSIKGVVMNGSPMVVIGVPYAEALQGRYGFAGICPQWQPELNRRLQPILDAGAYLAG